MKTVYHVVYNRNAGFRRKGAWQIIKNDLEGRQYGVGSADHKKDAKKKAKKKAKKQGNSKVKVYYKDKSKGLTNTFDYGE